MTDGSLFRSVVSTCEPHQQPRPRERFSKRTRFEIVLQSRVTSRYLARIQRRARARAQLCKQPGADIVIYIPPVTHMVISVLSTKLSALQRGGDYRFRRARSDSTPDSRTVARRLFRYYTRCVFARRGFSLSGFFFLPFPRVSFPPSRRVNRESVVPLLANDQRLPTRVILVLTFATIDPIFRERKEIRLLRFIVYR